MITFVRILIVWMTALLLVAMAMGAREGQDFIFMFAIYGGILTIPAVLLFLLAGAVERTQLGGFAGVVFGALTFAGLYLAMPHKERFADVAWFFFAMTVGSGILWSVSFYLTRSFRRA